MQLHHVAPLLILLYLKYCEGKYIISPSLQCENYGNSIIRFNCSSRGLTSLENVFSKNIDSVYSLDVSGNELYSLNGLENMAVQNLRVSYNHISALPGNLLGRSLSSLEASHNDLTSLDISGAVNVWSLSVHDNYISEFRVPELRCSLRFLDLSNNRLKYIPSVFHNCKHLYFVNISRNMIHNLPHVLMVTKKPSGVSGRVFVDLRRNPLPEAAVLAAVDRFSSSHGPLSLAVNNADCACAKLKSVKGSGRTMLQLCVTSMCENSINLWKTAVSRSLTPSNAESVGV